MIVEHEYMYVYTFQHLTYIGHLMCLYSTYYTTLHYKETNIREENADIVALEARGRKRVAIHGVNPIHAFSRASQNFREVRVNFFEISRGCHVN